MSMSYLDRAGRRGTSIAVEFRGRKRNDTVHLTPDGDISRQEGGTASHSFSVHRYDLEDGWPSDALRSMEVIDASGCTTWMPPFDLVRRDWGHVAPRVENADIRFSAQLDAGPLGSVCIVCDVRDGLPVSIDETADDRSDRCEVQLALPLERLLLYRCGVLSTFELLSDDARFDGSIDGLILLAGLAEMPAYRMAFHLEPSDALVYLTVLKFAREGILDDISIRCNS